MTAYETLAIDFDCCTPHSGEAGDSAESAPSGRDPGSLAHFPSAPIEGDTLATVQLVAHDWRADEDWHRFEKACRICADIEIVQLGHAHVYPDHVRLLLTNPDGELSLKPQRLSGFYHRAAGKAGFLDFSHWDISEDTKGRNQGKPCRIYKLRSNA